MLAVTHGQTDKNPQYLGIALRTKYCKRPAKLGLIERAFYSGSLRTIAVQHPIMQVSRYM